MTDSENIFFDTSPFIYLVENHPKYYLPVANFITEQIVEKESQLFTSVISIAEFCVRPTKENNLKLISEFESVLHELSFHISDINYNIAKQSSVLRARYDFLKGIDSIQIATAISLNCKKFFTNDKQLRLIKEVDITVIEDLI